MPLSIGGLSLRDKAATAPGCTCSSTCASQTFAYGTSVTLHAIGDLNAIFDGWSDDCGSYGVNDCTLVMNKARTATATFTAANALTLTLAGTGSGTVGSSPAGIKCSSGSTVGCSAPYRSGDVILTATPATGTVFAGWGGGCNFTSPTASTCSAPMYQAQTVTAVFNLQKFNLTVGTSGSSTGSGTITADKGPINCGSSCVGSYDYNTVVTLTATPASGSTFVSWSNACSSSSTTCVVTMNAAAGAVATFNAVPETLTVTTSGTGTGTVTSNPAGISCPGTCSKVYNQNTSVVLTAAATGSSTFAGWTGACPNATGTCTVSMTTAKSVGATFNLAGPCTLTVDIQGSGAGGITSSPAGISCGNGGSVCSKSYAANTPLVLTETPSANASFIGWTNCPSTTGATCNVTMNQAQSVTANFSANTFVLSVVSGTAGSGAGTVTSNPVGINCAGGTCSAAFNNNSPVVLTATPGANFIFNGWSGACVNSSGTCSVVMSQAQSVTASFAPSTFVVTVTKPTASGAGVVSSPAGINCNSGAGSTCSASFATNSSVTLTVSTNSSVSFTGWGNDDCANAGGATTCNLAITTARTVTANFTQLYQLTVLVAGVGRGTVTTADNSITCSSGSCSAMYPSGTTVTLIGTAAPGSSPIGWSACQGSAPCAVIIGGAAQTVNATFGCAYNYIVDPSVGLDTNSGSCQQPFLTIGRGLKTATRGQNVFAAPATYDNTRETFPLTVPDGVSLLGDVSTKGSGTKLVGGGPSAFRASYYEAVHATGAAMVSGFTITDANPAAGAATGSVVQSNATFSNNTFTGTTTFAVYVTAGAAVFLNNAFANNGNGLVYVGGANGRVQGNTFTSNANVGLELDVAAADLGGGSLSTGGNTFSCNTNIDVYVGSGFVNADNNLWDHAPPTVGTTGGADLYKGGTVTTANAAAAAGGCQ